MKSIKLVSAILVVLLLSAAVAWAGSQGSVEYSGLPLFFLCATIGFLLHWLVFIPSFLTGTDHYFDLTGSLSYLATLAVAFFAQPQPSVRALLVSLMIAVWAVRLGTFLFLRVKRAGKDRRFDQIKTNFLRFLFSWTLGGAWVFITMAAALTIITSSADSGLDAFFFIGAVLWLTGFGFEITADAQKTRFRKDRQNEAKFITSGLWSVSRHPNYFGEILLWTGIAIIALPTLQGWQFITLISPVFVTLLLTRVSGINLLEASAEERWGSDPEYQAYVNKTPVLVPLLGKKG